MSAKPFYMSIWKLILSLAENLITRLLETTREYMQLMKHIHAYLMRAIYCGQNK